MHDLGDTITLAIEIRDSAGTLANATAVACTLTAPDGNSSSLAVANTATGKYTALATPATAGRYAVRWVATGTNAGAFTDAFTVADEAPLLALAEVRAHLNITDTDADEELRTVLAAATSAIEDHLQRDVTRKTRTDTVRVIRGGGSVLVLRRPDVHSITSVVEDGTTLTADVDYIADTATGVLYRQNTHWTAPLTITWTTGAANTPAIRQAALEMVRHLWDTQRGTMRGLPRTGELMTPGTGYSLPNRVLELLASERTHT